MKTNVFHIHTIYYKTSMKSSAMVYFKKSVHAIAQLTDRNACDKFLPSILEAWIQTSRGNHTSCLVCGVFMVC